MAYYLTDPYYYTAKCYPYLNENKNHYNKQHESLRLTANSREIENKMVLNRLRYSSDIDEENKSS
jgi:hypothetical protein